ncbi:MAG: hypothetical protein WD226_03120 [Planctomycetota bacterium]
MNRSSSLAVIAALAFGCDASSPYGQRISLEANEFRTAEYQAGFEHGRAIPLLSADDLFDLDPRSTAPFPTTALQWSFDHADDGWLTNLASARARRHSGTVVPGLVGRALVPHPPGFFHPLPERLRDEWSVFTRFQQVASQGHVLSIGDAVSMRSTARGVEVTASDAKHEFVLEPGWCWIGVTFEYFGDDERASVLLCTKDEQVRLRLPALPRVQRGRAVHLAAGVAHDEFRIEHGPLSTLAHMRLDDPPRQRVRRTARFSGPGVDEAVELWSAHSTDLELEGRELGRFGALDHLVPDDDGLVWTSAQWRQHETDLGPRPRTTHPTVALGDGKVWIFGGETKDSHAWPQWNDAQVWIYDVLRYSWRRIPEHEGWPHARAHLPASYWAAGNVIWSRGGWFNSEGSQMRSFQDVWNFDITSERFQRWELAGLPSASDMSVVSAPDAPNGAVLLGLYTEIFDLETMQLVRREQASAFDADGSPLDLPQIVSSAHAFDPARDRVLLFGGESGRAPKDFHAITFAYEPTANELRVVTREGPSARSRPGFARDAKRDRFVLFGGVRGQDSERFDDLWSFDPETSVWREHTFANGPSGRGGYFGMAYDEATDAFYLVHGRHSLTIFLDEVWQLTLRDEATATAGWCFSSDDWSAAKTAWVTGDWVPSDAVEIALATSTDGLHFLPQSAALTGSGYVRLTVTLTASDPERPPRITGVGLGPEEPRDLGPEVARVAW